MSSGRWWSPVVVGGRWWSLVVVSQPGRTDKPDTSPESVPPPSNRLWSEHGRHRPARAAHQSRSIFKFCLFKLSNRAPLGCGLPAVVIPAACTIPANKNSTKWITAFCRALSIRVDDSYSNISSEPSRLKRVFISNLHPTSI